MNESKTKSNSSSRYRSSVRSKGSASSYHQATPREKVRDCCRKIVAFMCTQVGVGGLIVGYAVVGAFSFIAIEGAKERPEYKSVIELRANCTAQLWELTTTENVFNQTRWKMKATAILKGFQNGVAHAVKAGYDGRTAAETWSFPAALMFCLSIFTMIGYGNMVPRTSWGKLATVVYAVFGIPLYVLYFMNMGQVLASTFKWVYTKLCECSLIRDPENPEPPRIVVPSTACLWVMGAYIATGTIMFAEWEKWNYLDSTYFCVTSLCKIGIGDFVPGANILESKSGNQTKLIINFVYLLLGMGLVAMCYNLMREVVKVKMHDFKEDILHCFEDMRLRTVECYQRRRSPDR
ncbi:two pore potassium channel protein sup-9 [Rhodnius prolixus]